MVKPRKSLALRGNSRKENFGIKDIGIKDIEIEDIEIEDIEIEDIEIENFPPPIPGEDVQPVPAARKPPPLSRRDALHKLYDEDFIRFAGKVLRVQSTDGKIVPLVFNSPQKLLHAIIERTKKLGRPVRIIGLKSRRMGFSTYFSARNYHKTSRRKNRYATQVTHEPEATDTLFKMVKRFYNFTPDWMRPRILYNNSKLLEFNTKDGRGLNSGFRVGTAEKEDFGSGQLIHYLHLSEVAKWKPEKIRSLLTSILQCVPDDPESEVVFESTAKGIGGEFYDRFWGARYRAWVMKLDKRGHPIVSYTVNEDADENNNYTSIFLPWFIFELYEVATPDGFELTAEELEMKSNFNLRDGQIYWRRLTMANKCGGSEDLFRQEYPATPKEAFLGTGRPVFDAQKVHGLMEAAEGPVARYDCLTGLRQWITKPGGRLKVWEEPRAGCHYIVSADVAEGLEKGDFSCADVIEHRTGRQVAQWHGHCDPDEFGVILMALGRRYNEAWLVPERNNHGLTTVTVIVNEGYPKIYAEMIPEPPGKPRKRYGWVTTNATRPLIIDNLIMEVRESSHGIVCRETFDEMLTFKVQKNGKMEADTGRFDDRVLSMAIAKHARQVLDLPAMGNPDHYKKQHAGGGWNRKSVSSLGWT